MKIARARPEQAAALTAIAVAAKRHWGYPESWIRRWEAALTITPDYVSAHATYAAFVDETMIGFCALHIQSAQASLEHLWVLPSAMGRGAGRALFAQAEQMARESGAGRMKIVSDPHAEGFYRRMGAARCGEELAAMDDEARVLPVLEKVFQACHGEERSDEAIQLDRHGAPRAARDDRRVNKAERTCRPTASCAQRDSHA